MNNSAQLLNIFHIGFIVFMVLAVVFLLISIALFVKFDIKGIWEQKSGKAKAKAIQKKQGEENQQEKKRLVPELEESKELARTAKTKSKAQNLEEVQFQEEKETEVLDQSAIVPPPQPVEVRTETVQDGSALTTALTPEDQPVTIGKFLIVKQIMYVHTNEVI